MLLKPACKQLTLVQSDISPIDIASYLYLLSTLSLLHEVGNVIYNNNGLKRKLKVSTVDIQNKRSGLRVSNSKVFSSGISDIPGIPNIPGILNITSILDIPGIPNIPGIRPCYE